MNKNKSSDHKPNSGIICGDDLLCKAYYHSVKAVTELTTTQRNSKSGYDRNCEKSVHNYDKLQTNKFEIGDYVRATYEDGIDYEAKIISINRETDICVVKYIGFDNEQQVDLSSLITSWGKKARRAQFNKAKKCIRPNLTNTTTKENMVWSNEFNFETFPPAPALPPNMVEGSEHLSAMLMAWYMSGYYTGIYEGRTKRNENSNKGCL